MLVSASSLYQVVPTVKSFAPPICKAGVMEVPQTVIGATITSLLVTLGMGLPCGYSMIPLLVKAELVWDWAVLTLNRPALVKVPALLTLSKMESLAQALLLKVEFTSFRTPSTAVCLMLISPPALLLRTAIAPVFTMPLPVKGVFSPIRIKPALVNALVLAIPLDTPSIWISAPALFVKAT